MEADSEATLREQLARTGGVVLDARPTANGGPARVVSRSFEIRWWCRELRTLLRAGMTVVEAIDTLHEHAAGDDRTDVHATLRRALAEGQSLSRAMRSAGVFSDVLVAGIAASERTGTVVAALDDYLRYDELMQQLRRQAVSAAIYPAVVVGLGFVISLFLLFYVVPRFSRMYGSSPSGLSTVTQMVLWLSAALRDWGGLVFAGVVALALLGLKAWRSGALGAAVLRLAESVPALRVQLDRYRLAKLYQSLALMFRGGYALDEAMAVCDSLQLGPRIGEGLKRSRHEISRGRAVSSALAAGGLTDTVAQRLLAAGERTGEFDAVLQTIADRHAEAFATFVERATRIVEPLLLLGVALAVGGIVVMMYMPIFDIANTVR